MAPRVAAGLLVATLAAACAGAPAEEERAAQRALADITAARAALEAMRQGLPPHAVAPRPVAPPPRADRPAVLARSPRSASDLAGLGEADLRALLGEPDLVREEGEVRAWLYRGPSCLLDVFLEGEGDARVVLAAARGVGLERVPEEVCLRSLSRGRAGLPRS
ncbi:hypothetical protein [Elioraea thermophila]|uniref:hypothetical protein n=1 Tax=Elioraea thermophila TaxID=2185104 RepID=UPI0013009B41|nr:hypothetical protein [Elioraea thermophila]